MPDIRDPFKADPFPGRGRILFVGDVHGSHARSWIDIARKSNVNVRGFGSAHGTIPADMGFPCYSPLPRRPRIADVKPLFTNRPLPAAILRALDEYYSGALLERALCRVIRQWQPDIVHTFGIFPASAFYLRTRRRLGARSPHWVVQARGGPDIELNRHLEDRRPTLQSVLSTCDSFIADTDQNLAAAVELGLPPDRRAAMGRVPGTGGIDVDELAGGLDVLPSRRDRLILIPKGYEHLQSKVLPVLEGLKLAWPQLAPCKVICTAVNADAVPWIAALPPDIRSAFEVRPRVPRAELLQLMKQARVMLAPSVMDGIPNTLLEAMAAGAVPVVSPLPTITPHVSEPENVIFARNLYPGEIADALVAAMNGGAELDVLAQNNLALVREIGDRGRFEQPIRDFYDEIFRARASVKI